MKKRNEVRQQTALAQTPLSLPAFIDKSILNMTPALHICGSSEGVVEVHLPQGVRNYNGHIQLNMCICIIKTLCVYLNFTCTCYRPCSLNTVVLYVHAHGLHMSLLPQVVRWQKAQDIGHIQVCSHVCLSLWMWHKNYCSPLQIPQDEGGRLWYRDCLKCLSHTPCWLTFWDN